MSTRRRSTRLMPEKERKSHEEALLKAAAEKIEKEASRLNEIDALISALSPRTSRRTKSGLGRIQSAHKSHLRLRTKKKEMQKKKAKATREFNKRVKTAKLNKENKEVVSALMHHQIPLDIALTIAEDRQHLQKTEAELERKIAGLKSLIPGTEAAISSVQIDVDAMEKKQLQDPSQWDSEDSGDEEWLDWYLNDTRRQLRGIQRNHEENLAQIAKLEEELRKFRE